MNLLSAFQYGFMIRALIAGCVVGVIAPLIGMFLVTRKYAFMADTLGHVSLAGIAIGALLGTSPVLAAVVCSVLAALCVERLRATGRVMGDAGLSLFLSGGLAVASVLISLGGISGIGLQSLLFGSIATVTPLDVWVILALGLAVTIVVVLLYRPFFSVSYDEELASASGLPVEKLNAVLVVLAAIVVSVGLRIVGTLLISALIVIPVLSAMQLKRGFLRTLIIACCLSVFSVCVGLLLSFHAGIASGGSIVIVNVGLFLLCALFGRKN